MTKRHKKAYNKKNNDNNGVSRVLLYDFRGKIPPYIETQRNLLYTAE